MAGVLRRQSLFLVWFSIAAVVVVLLAKHCLKDSLAPEFAAERRRLVPRAIRADLAPGVTLALALDAARVPTLLEIATAGGGPVAAVVAVATAFEASGVYEAVATLSNLQLTLWREPRLGVRFHFPANFLRNLALESVATEYALVLDVDMMPSLGLHAALERWTEALTPAERLKTVLAVAAFETGPRVATPRTLAALETVLRTGDAKPVLAEHRRPRSLVEWDPSHVWFIDYPRWHIANSTCAREPNSFENEPFVVVPMGNPCLPPYDERFYMRGADRQEYVQPK